MQDDPDAYLYLWLRCPTRINVFRGQCVLLPRVPLRPLPNQTLLQLTTLRINPSLQFYTRVDIETSGLYVIGKRASPSRALRGREAIGVIQIRQLQTPGIPVGPRTRRGFTRDGGGGGGFRGSYC